MTESERRTDPIKAPWIPNHREVQLPRRIRNCMQIHWAVQSFEGSDGRVPKHPNGPKVDPTTRTQITGVLENDTLPNKRLQNVRKRIQKVGRIIFCYTKRLKSKLLRLSCPKQRKTRKKKTLQKAGFCNSQLKKLPPATVPYSNVSQLDHNLGSEFAHVEDRRLWRVYEKKKRGEGGSTLW